MKKIALAIFLATVCGCAGPVKENVDIKAIALTSRDVDEFTRNTFVEKRYKFAPIE